MPSYNENPDLIVCACGNEACAEYLVVTRHDDEIRITMRNPRSPIMGYPRTVSLPLEAAQLFVHRMKELLTAEDESL